MCGHSTLATSCPAFGIQPHSMPQLSLAIPTLFFPRVPSIHLSASARLPFIRQLLLGFQRHTLREARDLYAAPLPRLRTAILLRKAVRQRPRPPPPRRGHPHPQQVPLGATPIVATLCPIGAALTVGPVVCIVIVQKGGSCVRTAVVVEQLQICVVQAGEAAAAAGGGPGGTDRSHSALLPWFLPHTLPSTPTLP